MPMYGQKKVKITGTATSKPAAKKPTMPGKGPAKIAGKGPANMAKMNKSKPAEITKGQATRAVKPASKIKPRKGMM